MKKIIGNINQIAIEYSISNNESFMGYAKLWLGGNMLGAPNDLIYFESYLFNLLYQFENSKELIYPFTKYEEIELFNALKKYTFDDEEYNASIYSCTGSTFTDDFYIFSYLKNGIINILWKLTENYNYEELRFLDNKFFHFKMHKEKFSELLEEYVHYIKLDRNIAE